MADHSKWAGIKHRKKQQDAKKDKVFTKLICELIVTTRRDGGAPADNSRLRLAMDKALTANMTHDTIDRAIARSVGSSDADDMVELLYEGYAPSGVAIIVEAITGDHNRTAAEVRRAFSKCGGNLGTDDSIAYVFGHKGQISFAPGVDEEVLMNAALGTGADDVIVSGGGSIDAFTTFTDFISVNEVLVAAGFESDETEVTVILSTTATLDLETAQKVLKLVDMFEDLDGVQNTCSNTDIPGDVMAQFG